MSKKEHVVFTPGELVECTDDEGTSGRLKKGERYEVRQYQSDPPFAGDPALTVVGIWGPWMAARFKKV